MTPHFSRFSRRLSTLKWIFISSIVITVFALTASFYIGFQYFVSKRGLLAEQGSLISRFEKLENLDLTLRNSEAILAKKFDGQNTPQNRELHLLTRINKWEEVRSLLQESGIRDENFKAGDAVASEEKASIAIQNFQSLVLAEKKSSLKQMKTITKSMDTNQKDALIVGVIVLIFGFFIPYLTLKIASKLINQLRLQLEKTAYDIVKTWSEERTKFGESAFKNVEFWLRIILVVGHHSGSMSSHPVPQMMGELAYLVQVELGRLEKERNSKVA